MKKPFLHLLQDYFLPHPRNNHRPHLFSVASVAALVFAVVIFEAGYLVQTKIVFIKTDFLASVLPGVLASLTNEARAANGITPVIHDALLDAAAEAAALDMATKGYFAHVSPDGKDPWYWLNQAGYTYSYAGENLAVNFTDSENVQTAWMESPTHRANIVKPQYTQVGFGTANGMYEGRETTFVVEFFATPSTSSGVGAPTESVGAAVPKTAVSTNTEQVLGSEIENSSADTAGAAAAAAPAITPSWLTRLLASPLHTLIVVLTILFTIIAALLTIAIVVRANKMQHPTVLIGGALLLAIISGSMLFSSGLAGSVQLNSGAQTAAAGAAFPR